MNVAGECSSPNDPRYSQPYSVFVFNAGGCGGCEFEVLSLFLHSQQSEGFRCKFVSQPESADLILLFGSLNREAYQVLKAFFPRFNPSCQRLAVGACAIAGTMFQSAGWIAATCSGTAQGLPHAFNSSWQNPIQEFSPNLYVAGCPPTPEDIWQGLHRLACCGSRLSAEASQGVETNRIEFHSELCLGCGLCQQICPAQAIRLSIAQELAVGEAGSILVEFNQAACLFCSLCEQLCPTGCLKLSGSGTLIRQRPQEFVVRGCLSLVRCLNCQGWMVAMPKDFIKQTLGSLPDQRWLELCPTCRKIASARYLKTAAEGLQHLHQLIQERGC